MAGGQHRIRSATPYRVISKLRELLGVDEKWRHHAMARGRAGWSRVLSHTKRMESSKSASATVIARIYRDFEKTLARRD